MKKHKGPEYDDRLPDWAQVNSVFLKTMFFFCKRGYDNTDNLKTIKFYTYYNFVHFKKFKNWAPQFVTVLIF